jgi:hypothetical protein
MPEARLNVLYLGWISLAPTGFQVDRKALRLRPLAEDKVAFS